MPLQHAQGRQIIEGATFKSAVALNRALILPNDIPAAVMRYDANEIAPAPMFTFAGPNGRLSTSPPGYCHAMATSRILVAAGSYLDRVGRRWRHRRHARRGRAHLDAPRRCRNVVLSFSEGLPVDPDADHKLDTVQVRRWRSRVRPAAL